MEVTVMCLEKVRTTWRRRRPRAGIAFTLAAALLGAGAAAAEPLGQASTYTGGGLTAVLVRGEAPPLGAVVILPDSMGPDRRHDWAIDAMVGAGLLVLVVQAPEASPAAASLAARTLVADGLVPSNRVAVLGHGAGGLLAAAADFPFAARVLHYPGCAALADVAGPPAPLLVLHGVEDPVNSAEQCGLAAAELRAKGSEVTRLAYRSAGYAWDMPHYGAERVSLVPAPGQNGRVRAITVPGLAEIAAADSTRFILAAFGRNRS
jgi:dienelactone hydrolase